MDVHLQKFQHYILRWYGRYGRTHLPWRQTTDPYRILLSELMLQQTQVGRVIPKYVQFVQLFPDVKTLAQAPQAAVLSAWQGLGYNRRARFLHQAAQAVMSRENQRFPTTQEELLELPGIGPYTSGAVMAFAYNQPVTLIETNVRTVFLHHFFPEQTGIVDGQLLPLIQASLPADDARVWYAALMDYGSYLKSVLPNPSRRSRTHAKQTRFDGSRRQVRGAILRALATNTKRTEREVLETVELELRRSLDTREFSDILGDLIRDGLVQPSQNGTRFSL